MKSYSLIKIFILTFSFIIIGLSLGFVFSDTTIATSDTTPLPQPRTSPFECGNKVCDHSDEFSETCGGCPEDCACAGATVCDLNPTSRLFSCIPGPQPQPRRQIPCNRPKSYVGSLKIIKKTRGGDSIFNFTPDGTIAPGGGYGNIPPSNITTSSGYGEASTINLSGGSTYNILETLPPYYWAFDSGSCVILSTPSLPILPICGDETCEIAEEKEGDAAYCPKDCHKLCDAEMEFGDTEITKYLLWLLNGGGGGGDGVVSSCGKIGENCPQPPHSCCGGLSCDSCGKCGLGLALPGKLRIIKEAIGEDNVFTFATGGGPITTIGGYGEITIENIYPTNKYILIENVGAHWTVNDFACKSESGFSTGISSMQVAKGYLTKIEIRSGETTTCVSKSTKNASLRIIQKATGGTGSFTYKADPFSGHFATIKANQRTGPDEYSGNSELIFLEPGKYKISEVISDDWVFNSASCITMPLPLLPTPAPIPAPTPAPKPAPTPVCPPPSSCGNKICDAGENCGICPKDCGDCVFSRGTCVFSKCVLIFSPSYISASQCAENSDCIQGKGCGDGFCGLIKDKDFPSEDCSNCPDDCGPCIITKPWFSWCVTRGGIREYCGRDCPGAVRHNTQCNYMGTECCLSDSSSIPSPRTLASLFPSLSLSKILDSFSQPSQFLAQLPPPSDEPAVDPTPLPPPPIIDLYGINEGNIIEAVLVGSRTTVCTFKSTKKGILKIVTQTIGGDATERFDYDIKGYDNIAPSVRSSESAVFINQIIKRDIDRGDERRGSDEIKLQSATTSYLITQKISEGWELNSVVCELRDGSKTGLPTIYSYGINNVTIQPDKTTTCTFTNTKKGKLKIIKMAEQAIGGEKFDYDINFVSTGYLPPVRLPLSLQPATATVEANKAKTIEIYPGIYQVTEYLPTTPETRKVTAIWSIDAIDCKVISCKPAPLPPPLPPPPSPCSTAGSLCGTGCCTGLFCSSGTCGTVPPPPLPPICVTIKNTGRKAGNGIGNLDIFAGKTTECTFVNVLRVPEPNDEAGSQRIRPEPPKPTR